MIEALRDASTGPQREDAREHLERVLADAAGRREKLERQLAMADEFISQLNQQLD